MTASAAQNRDSGASGARLLIIRLVITARRHRAVDGVATEIKQRLKLANGWL